MVLELPECSKTTGGPFRPMVEIRRTRVTGIRVMDEVQLEGMMIGVKSSDEPMFKPTHRLIALVDGQI